MPVRSKEWDNGVRASVLTLWAEGKPVKDILKEFDMPKTTFYSLQKKAQSRGWVKGNPVELKYIEDAPRSGK